MITTRELDALLGRSDTVPTTDPPPVPPVAPAPSPDERSVFWPCDLRDQAPAVVRYFAQSILPGTPVVTAVRLRMRGRLRLGRLWLPFRAEEILAPRRGFRWAARVGGMIRGADSGGVDGARMRWRLAGLVTLVDEDGADVTRSAAGRCGAEAIWAPGALLPGPAVDWSALDDRHLRARFAVGDVPVDLHLQLDEAGRPQAFRTMRWGDPDGSGRSAWHPFGGRVTATRTFGSVVVPASGAVGWYPDAPDARRHEFLRFRVTGLEPAHGGPRPER